MPQVSFSKDKRQFHIELNQRVNEYFKTKQLSQRGNAKLFFKAFFMLGSLFTLWAVLVFMQPLALWLNIVLLMVFGTFMAFIGFNVMHDSCHGAFSNNSVVNDVFGYSMNLLGAECRFWKVKHNVLHHTFTNIDGVDDDIFKPPFLRMSPNQPYRKIQKYQAWYMILLYSISVLFWVYWMDFAKYFTNKVHTTDLPKKKLVDHVSFWGTKLFHIGFYIIVPGLVLGFKTAFVGYFIAMLTLGVVISIVFQLAHVVEGAAYADAQATGVIEVDEDWAIYQMQSTFDFCPDNAFLTWSLGGLNYQVEHHLFPKVSHVHYPAIRKIVKEVALKYGVQHNEFSSFWSAVKSHFGMMHHLGGAQYAKVSA